MADQSWRDQPRAMSPQIAELTARRIGEHALAHGLPGVTLILHGGEPLLGGQDLIAQLITATRQAADPDVAVDTNTRTSRPGLSDAFLRCSPATASRSGSASTGTR